MQSGDGGAHTPEPRADRSALSALREQIGDCRRCPLSETRHTLVFGVGDPHARLMFIGEAPGRNEDMRGEPFVGAAGKLLDELLASIGFDRSRVYIANVLKCRPPGNRDPQPGEIATCTPYLAEQIRLIAPQVIVTLGNFATRYMLDTDRGISQLHGRLFDVDGRRVVPIYHPAAALYSPDKRQVLFEDFLRLRTVLRWAAEGGHPSHASEAGEELVVGARENPPDDAGQDELHEESEQSSLF